MDDTLFSAKTLLVMSKRKICHSSEQSLLVLGVLRKCTKPYVDMYFPSENKPMSFILRKIKSHEDEKEQDENFNNM